MAKILLCTYSMYGAWFTIRLQQEGHSVDIYLDDKDNPDLKYVLGGLIKPVLLSKPDFRKYDLVIFDLTGRPKLAEECRSLNVPCIGDGDLNSEIEDDRLLGIQIMEQCDINVPPYEQFNDISDAKRFVRKTNKRYVFKPFGGQEQDTATTYVSKSADDLLRYFDHLSRESKGAEFILQEFIEGTEISTEAWFNGEDFYLINGTLEEKKFMDEGRGPNTGCSGNLVWLYEDYKNELNQPLIFREGLGKLKDFLKEYNYVGMIDLNTIVTDSKLYGLEWTPRFGYDASASIFACISSDLGDFFGSIASGSRPEIQCNNKYSASIRLSIPPYPSEIKGKHQEDVPIEGIEEDDIIKNCFLYDCYSDKSDSLFTVGVNGFVCCPIQTGGSIQQTFRKLGTSIEKINIPNVQYRNDIEHCCTKRYDILSRQGWLSQ